MGVRLPSAYQEVEYIQSSGSQFINISDEYNQYEYSAVVAFRTTRNQYACLCGWFDDQYIGTNIGYSGSMRSLRSNGRNTSKSAGVTSADYIGQKLKFDCFKNYARISNPDTGVVLAENTDYFELVESPIWLFHCDSNKSYMRTRYVSAKLYGFKVYLSGGLIHDLVPCYRKTDNKPGMYDIVTKQFFTNAGTGEFLVGPDVIESISPLMVAWRRMLMKEPEHWDLVLEAQADGTIPAVNATSTHGITWGRGQTLTIAWDATGFDANTTRIMLYTNNGGPIVYEYQLTDTIGQMSLNYNDYETTARTRTVLLSRSWENRNGPKFKGNYIKIRVT